MKRDRYRTTVHWSLKEVGDDRWNALAPPSLYLAPDWLSAVDGTLSPSSAFIVVERDGDGPVAGLVAYPAPQDAFLFQNPPKLALGEGANGQLEPFQSAQEQARTTRLVGRLSGVLTDAYPTAVCVVPYAFTVSLCQRRDDREAVELLLDGFEEVAAGWGARGRAVLYVPSTGHQSLNRCLRDRGFVSGVVGARCVMPVEWTSFDTYLASFSSQRRKAIKGELQAFERSGLSATVVNGSSLSSVADRLAYLSARVQEKYGHGFDVEREKLTLRIIETHFSHLTKVILVHEGDEILAFHLFYDWDNKFYAGLAGQEYARVGNQSFAHFLAVYYEPVRLAMARGVELIDYGVEGYATKISRGCNLQHLTAFFDFGAAAKPELTELLSLQSSAQQRRLDSYRRLHRPR